MQWHILSELCGCKEMSKLTAFAASDERVINREYPFRPFPIAADEGVVVIGSGGGGLLLSYGVICVFAASG
jgi:hypothetical protein